MSRIERRQHVLDLVIPRLEEEGYSVFVQPPQAMLPKFMQGYQPDAVAIGRPRNLAIAIHQDRQPSGKLETLTKRFSGIADWELRVYYDRPGTEDTPLAPLQADRIHDGIATVENLLSIGQPDAALLFGWGVLEAVGRAVLPKHLDRPVPAGRLVERLATEGVITPDEADRLRALLGIRNRIAHGDLDTHAEPGQVDDLVAILRVAMDEAHAPAV